MSYRSIKRRIKAVDSRDGAGVRIRRSVGSSGFARIDPFLMLDCFSSDNPDDYVAGFPAHPHRGFETVTYMIDGLMKHKDHMGNEGILRPGGVQWMTAGRGVIHEEMPQQEHGLMRGFQLWVNLPSAEKMKPAAYQNLDPDEIVELELSEGARIRLVAGEVDTEQGARRGPVTGISRQPLFLELQLEPLSNAELSVPSELKGFVYLYEGEGKLGDEVLNLHEAAELSGGDCIKVTAGSEELKLMVIAGLPVNEPIAQYGPFVMNTQAELDQAIADYRANRLTE